MYSKIKTKRAFLTFGMGGFEKRNVTFIWHTRVV